MSSHTCDSLLNLQLLIHFCTKSHLIVTHVFRLSILSYKSCDLPIKVKCPMKKSKHIPSLFMRLLSLYTLQLNMLEIREMPVVFQCS